MAIKTRTSNIFEFPTSQPKIDCISRCYKNGSDYYCPTYSVYAKIGVPR
jgi:hypothetical protein